MEITDKNNLHKTRKEASKAGAKFYYTGTPCKYGHKSPRYTSTGNCVACLDGGGKISKPLPEDKYQRTGRDCKHGHKNPWRYKSGACIPCTLKKQGRSYGAWARKHLPAKYAADAEIYLRTTEEFKVAQSMNPNRHITAPNYYTANWKGYDKYLSDAPCSKCGTFKRYTISKRCVECTRTARNTLTWDKEQLKLTAQYANENKSWNFIFAKKVLLILLHNTGAKQFFPYFVLDKDPQLKMTIAEQMSHFFINSAFESFLASNLSKLPAYLEHKLRDNKLGSTPFSHLPLPDLSNDVNDYHKKLRKYKCKTIVDGKTISPPTLEQLFPETADDFVIENIDDLAAEVSLEIDILYNDWKQKND